MAKSEDFDHLDETASVRADIMQAYTTLLALSQKAQTGLTAFEQAIDLSCQQILEASKDIAVQGIMKLRSITLPFFNTLLITRGVDLLAYIQSKVNIDQFLEKWVDSMPYLNNAKTRRENAVAVIGVVQSAPALSVAKLFEALMGYAVPAVFQYLDERQGFKPKERPVVKRRMDSYSERREALAKESVIDSFDVLQLFQHAVKTFEANLQAASGKLEPFVNTGLQENMFKLMQAS